MTVITLAPNTEDQPKPKFTLVDLEKKLEELYTIGLEASKEDETTIYDSIKEINGIAQELLSIVTHCISDLEPIDLPQHSLPVLTQVINSEKPVFSVSGVQLIENRKIVGVSLYSTVIKARMIRDTLNKEFARLKVEHEAKILNYPVF